MGENISKATEKLFSERKDFIIIGLTGRTGSGCSIVAKLLGNSFEELCLPKAKESDFHNDEERKDKVVYEYVKSNWSKFKLIEMKNIITSFILKYSYEEFTNHLRKFKEDGIEITDIEKLFIQLEEHVKPKYISLSQKRREVGVIFKEKGDDALLDGLVYEYYFEGLGDLTKILQNVLKKHQANIPGHPIASLYTFYYQMIANNIRSSGDAFIDAFNPENIFKLSQRTNLLIKILRKRNLTEKNGVRVVIDALRNPFEASFFKDRYSAFYLMSVNTEDKHRTNRLINLGFSNEQIKNIDEQEYPKKLSKTDIFSSQDIQRCIEISDIFLHNPTIGTNDLTKVKQQLIRYVSLIMHPGLITPTAEERCMQIAINAKVNSGCLSRQVGAVVTDENYSIKSMGWNSVPEGQVPCNLRNLMSLKTKSDKEAFSDFEINNDEYLEYIEGVIDKKANSSSKLKGRLYPYCFKDLYNDFKGKTNQVHTRALHAEENAFLQIIKYGGISMKNGYLFTTASPCELCSKKAYQIGIQKIFYIDPYPGISNDHIINCGKQRPNMILFHGVIGRAYTQLYTQILPYKDELKRLMIDS